MMDWRSKASCVDEETDLFFPLGTSGPALAQIEQAKEICRRCKVAPQCLEWALATNQHDGVWADSVRTNDAPSGAAGNASRRGADAATQSGVTTPRNRGIWRGQVVIHDDFDELSAELLVGFSGQDR
jgi:WhiB family transcriptional regulator, redox-sensing transcriptional regulator